MRTHKLSGVTPPEWTWLRSAKAAAKLGDLAPALVPSQPWQEISSLGNRLRHEYHAIREDRLWDIVQIDLPPLCAACEDALRSCARDCVLCISGCPFPGTIHR